MKFESEGEVSMWIWQLIIRRAKKVTIPLTDENCTPFFALR